MASTKTRTNARRRDANVARRLLKALLHEAHSAERVRAELDGDFSDHVARLVEALVGHIELVERGGTFPDPARFRRWLDSVRSIPAGSPYRWRLASRRPLASASPSTTRESRPALEKHLGEVA